MGVIILLCLCWLLVIAAEPVPSGPIVLAAMPATAKPNVEATIAPVKVAEPVVAAPARPAPAVSPVHIPGPVPATATPANVAAAPGPTVSPMAALAIGLDTNLRRAAPVAEIDQASDAVASALGALAAGLAASAKPASPEIVVPTIDLDTSTARPAAATLPEAAALVQTTAVSVIPAPNGSLETAAHLDDTAAALLRPMLRQWLDSNMPRIVEKALRIELAANPLPLGGEKPKD